VRDEHDLAEDEGPELAAVPAEDGRPSWEADGSCRVQTLRRIGLEVPEGPYETVAGLVADLLGRIPAPGDRAELPGWKLSVRQVGRYRAERVRLVRLLPAPHPAPHQAPEPAPAARPPAAPAARRPAPPGPGPAAGHPADREAAVR
ncbi:transporter associated domain-containing protein, partial [Streptomyces sp. NPDC059456]|uniref:transporter associated domain-containing protein n=1 Tax=Streptomyces sp. NPDC059456 TaxID=3346838 RepID=UPI0036B11319